jgi:hypothetical protein
MWRAFKVATVPAALWLAGCTIHPLPDEVTGVSTFDIVKQIRCEARQAIFDFAIHWLVDIQDDDADARRIGMEFREGRRPIHEFNYTLFKPPIRQLVEPFFGTGIAYNFQLQMQEINNIDPMTDLLTLNGKNVFTSPVSGNADRIRQNLRTFTVTDTFGFLIHNIPDRPQNNDYCSGHIVGPNYIYPVAGKVGVDRMIDDFINLALFTGLTSPPSNAGNPTTASSKGPPTMVDQLQFTTTVSLAATPKVVFAPVKTFMDASLGLKFQRQDVHTLTIGLAITDKNSLNQITALRAGIFTLGPVGQLVSARPTTDSEIAAVQAVNQVLTQQLFKPVITITPTPAP